VRVIATAGHVDHGKSSLVRALTGTDPDRWEEEKRRGLTIDLGFAHTTLPSGEEIAIVDVPGHVRFVRNMLAGVGAVDACLFVVDASEGWKPQSEEHLRILELLGVTHGVVALTKTDLVDDDGRELALLDTADHLSGTFLGAAAMIPVAAPVGAGLDELRRALDDLVRSTPAATDRGRPRLWVDRAFAARGSGTVVTGTLTGGSITEGDRLVLGHDQVPVRVRGLQTLGRAVARIGPGSRVALNLVGVEHGDVERGDAVVEPGRWRPTTRIDASLAVLPALQHDVSRRGAYVAHIGAGEYAVRLRVLGGDVIAAGNAGLVRLHLPRALPLLPGDRYVLRESGRQETIGGGEVLDVAPIRPASKAHPDRSVDRVVDERGWVTVDELEMLTGERRPPTVGSWVAATSAVGAIREAVAAKLAAAGPLGLDTAALSERERLVLEATPDIVVEAGRARPAAAQDPLADHPTVELLRQGGMAPPDVAATAGPELRELVRRGLIIERDSIYFAPSAVDDAARVATALLAADANGFTVSQFRDAAGISRKYAVPLLAELDARAVTRRRGDLRVAGPRLHP
jgi:selenocysteine-specific elongation factor